MTEIPGDFAFRHDATLDSLEEGVRASVADQKTYMALIAVALGRILSERLYIKVAPSFKAYCRMDRVGIPYPQAQKLASAGSKYMEFRDSFHEHDIRFREHISKTALIDPRVVKMNPMFWERFPMMTVEALKRFNDSHSDKINVYSARPGHDGAVVAHGSVLSIDGLRLRGFNLNEARRQVRMGRRAVVFWVGSDTDARKVRRRLDGAI